jgi:hypothetical protein
MSTTSADRMRALRARRAAALASAPDPGPRDPAALVLPAVETTLAALALAPRYAAAAQLARVLASAIDEAESPAAAVIKLGPQLLKVLQALETTRAARLARSPGGRGGPTEPGRQVAGGACQHPAVRKRGF